MTVWGECSGPVGTQWGECSPCGFSGDYAPENWTFRQYFNGVEGDWSGSVDTSTAPSGITITGADEDSSNPSSVWYEIVMPADQTLTWGWKVDSTDPDPTYDHFEYAIDGQLTVIDTDAPYPEYGETSVAVAEGSTFAFVVSAREASNGPMLATIYDFCRSEYVAPPPGPDCVFEDTFTDPDATLLSSHTSDSGAAWSVVGNVATDNDLAIYTDQLICFPQPGGVGVPAITLPSDNYVVSWDYTSGDATFAGADTAVWIEWDGIQFPDGNKNLPVTGFIVSMPVDTGVSPNIVRLDIFDAGSSLGSDTAEFDFTTYHVEVTVSGTRVDAVFTSGANTVALWMPRTVPRVNNQLAIGANNEIIAPEPFGTIIDNLKVCALP